MTGTSRLNQPDEFATESNKPLFDGSIVVNPWNFRTVENTSANNQAYPILAVEFGKVCRR
jgi:hypothetical protein